jgi:hypothetical protein
MPRPDLLERDQVKVRRELPATQRTTSQHVAGKHADHRMLRSRHIAGTVELADGFVMVHGFETVKRVSNVIELSR